MPRFFTNIRNLIACLALLLVATALHAQTPVKKVANQSFGQATVNGTAVNQVLTYTFSGYANPVFSLAYSNLDYSIAGITCSGSGNITCALSINFRPMYPGQRQNAVIVKDTAGKITETTLLYGTGLGPQAIVYPGVLTTVAGKPGVLGLGSFGNFGITQATAATLFNPQGLAVDNLGNLYIADALNSAIRKVTPAGVISTVAGTLAMPGFTGDNASATSATLNNPIAMAFDGAGNLYIVDQANNRIREVSNGLITTVAGGGTGNSPNGIGDGGLATNAILNGPSDIAIDGAGNLFITASYAGTIRRVDAVTGVISTYASGLSNPQSIAVDAAGNLYIAESGMVRELDPQGNFTVLLQGGQPVCVRLDAAGNVYVADSSRNRVFQISAQTRVILTIAGNGGSGISPDGTVSTSAVWNSPAGIALDVYGNLYIADYANAVRKLTPLTALNFANTIVGMASTPQNLTLANIGTQPLTFGSFALNSNFAQQNIAGASCAAGLAIAGGATCAISVSFTPTSAVSVTGTISWTDNHLNNPTASQSVLLNGTGITGAVPRISINPSALSFAPQSPGKTSGLQNVTISNTGTAALNLYSMRLEGVNAGDFIVSGTSCQTTLAPNASCAVTFAFAPATSGAKAATFVLVDNLANSPQLTLSGSAGTPQVSLSPSALSFGAQPLNSVSVSKTITISNPGSVPVTLGNPVLVGASDFQVANNCGTTLNAGSSCYVTVSFSPQGAGTRTAAFTLSTNAAGVQTVGITGKTAVGATPLVWHPSAGMRYSQQRNANQWGLNGAIPVAGDYDGDGLPDFAIWNTSSGNWFIVLSSTGAVIQQQWGLPGDVPVAADYDGDGKTDMAVWRPSNGVWYVISSKTNSWYSVQYGLPGDVPVAADYDGDGKTDMAVWRPSNGTWYLTSSKTNSSSSIRWALSTDIPMIGDYDGDGKADLAVWRPSNGLWYIISSKTNSSYSVPYGIPGDVPIAADYDGDGKTDIAVWRPSNGTWYITSSKTNSSSSVYWALSSDIPVVADYDGDGKADLAVWRPSNATYYIVSSRTSLCYAIQWSLPSGITMASGR